MEGNDLRLEGERARAESAEREREWEAARKKENAELHATLDRMRVESEKARAASAERSEQLATRTLYVAIGLAILIIAALGVSVAVLGSWITLATAHPPHVSLPSGSVNIGQEETGAAAPKLP